MLRTAGTGYVFRYIGRNNLNVDFAYVLSPEFEVTIGPVYKIAFQQFVGTAAGGEAFLPNPIIIAVDRGENQITNINNEYCTAFLSKSPTGKEILKPVLLTTVQFFSGVATFQQLYLNESGTPYQVAFNTTMVYYLLFIIYYVLLFNYLLFNYYDLYLIIEYKWIHIKNK